MRQILSRVVSRQPMDPGKKSVGQGRGRGSAELQGEREPNREKCCQWRQREKTARAEGGRGGGGGGGGMIGKGGLIMGDAFSHKGRGPEEGKPKGFGKGKKSAEKRQKASPSGGERAVRGSRVSGKFQTYESSHSERDGFSPVDKRGVRKNQEKGPREGRAYGEKDPYGHSPGRRVKKKHPPTEGFPRATKKGERVIYQGRDCFTLEIQGQDEREDLFQ